MNILGWITTIVLTTSTILFIHKQDLNFSCLPKQLERLRADTENCYYGRRVSETDDMSAEPLGSCYGASLSHLRPILRCLVSEGGVDYLVAILKVGLTILLPIFFNNEQRVFVHSLINIATTQNGGLRIQSNFSLVCAVIVFVGTYVFIWDLGDDDGLLDSFARTIVRLANGKFA